MDYIGIALSCFGLGFISGLMLLSAYVTKAEQYTAYWKGHDDAITEEKKNRCPNAYSECGDPTCEFCSNSNGIPVCGTPGYDCGWIDCEYCCREENHKPKA